MQAAAKKKQHTNDNQHSVTSFEKINIHLFSKIYFE